jgi:hypothetical protein
LKGTLLGEEAIYAVYITMGFYRENGNVTYRVCEF